MSPDAYESPAYTGVWRFARDSVMGDETRLLSLLTGIDRTGSIASAAKEQCMSYRHAWGRIERWQAHFGQALVVAGRGKGSRLTPFALQLLALDTKIRKRLAPHLEAASAEMATLVGGQQDADTRVTLVASHDLALGAIVELLRTRGWDIDLRFRGSLEAVAALAAGRCDVAGFHCPGGGLGQRIWSQYRDYLSPRKHQLIRVCDRVQGLMVAKGNPKRVRQLRDLARNKIRFLNRQQGAGTRLVLDLLLQDQGLKPEDILGYSSEEHTHAAVAALIASGAADVGLGIEAAARRFGLDFVALVEETYFLACRRNAARSPGVAGLAAALASPEFAGIVAALQGYRCEGSGEFLQVTTVEHTLNLGAG